MSSFMAGNEKIAHLDFVQSLVRSHDAPSLLAKGSSIVVVLFVYGAYLFAPAAGEVRLGLLALIGAFLVFVLWLVDGHYTAIRASYVALYDEVRQSETTDFSLDASRFKTASRTGKLLVSQPAYLYIGSIVAIAALSFTV